MKKYASICYTLEFSEIRTATEMSYDDPLGCDFYFSLDEKTEVLGNALVLALSKSKDLSYSEEELAYINENCPPPPPNAKYYCSYEYARGM